MKKIAVFLSLFTALLIIQYQPIKSKEAFVIDNVDVEIKVSGEGMLQIKESYNLDFSSYRHGFYRSIPNVYKMDFVVNGKKETKTYYFPVTDIRSKENIDLQESKDGIVVRFGDPDKQVIGKQAYTLQYNVQMKDLRLSDESQMFYWDLIGSFDTDIRHVSYAVSLPKAVDEKNIQIFSGIYGQKNQNLTLNYTDQTIKGVSVVALQPLENATVLVNLPKGYFQFPLQKNTAVHSSLYAAILLIVSLLLFLKFGRDNELFISVEFQAPKDLTSADVGFIIDQSAETKDVVSLIIDWANRGYIKIYDEKEGFTLEKVKELSESDSLDYERIFFNALFEKEEKVTSKDLKTERVGLAIRDAKRKLKSSFYDHPNRRIYQNSSTFLQCIMVVVIALNMMLFSLPAAIQTFGPTQYAIRVIVPAIIMIGVCIIWILLMRKRYVLAKKYLLLANIALIVMSALVLSMNAYLQFDSELSSLGVVLCFFSTILFIVMMLFMDKRSKQGDIWLQQLLGLKEFIVTCEKERIELLVEEDPHSFFKIMPYAYVLGVSDVWAKKFENIAINMPDWYESDATNLLTGVLWWNHFHMHYNSMYHAAAFNQGVQGGSGVGGGSFGSGGFGGFSGGGFGGGGGGSW